MKELIRRSFKRQLLFCFLFVSVLPLIVCCVFLIQMFRIKVASDYQKKDMEQAALVEGRLTTLFDGIDQAVFRLTLDEQIKDVLEHGDFGKRSAIYRRLYEETATLRETARFDLYSADGVCLYSTGTGMFHQTLPAYWGILKVAGAHKDELAVRCEQESDRGSVLRFARAIEGDEETCIGFLVASMEKEDFDRILSGTYGSQDGICIVDRFMEDVYSAGTAEKKRIGFALRERMFTGETLSESYGDSSIYLSSLGETGLSSIFIRPVAFTEDMVRSMYMVLFFMAAASFLLCIAVSAWISGYLSKPIRVLNDAMDEIKRGRLKTRVHTGRIDEFGELADNFNVMTENLEDYMKKQVEQQKQLNEVQIAMMQAQLNPHFLYNTLDTMKWVAKANHIPEIATLAAKLAKILRTSISSAQFITLREELELVECYAQIQRIRFHGKFAFEYELPESLKEIPVPKLIVQPIVENAVIHGLADSEEGHILVRACRQGMLLIIEVCDDGCGISQEVVDHLNSRDREKLKGHIGFYNVDSIIRLHYGPEYGLTVQRIEQGGTKVMIVLPVQKEGGITDAKGSGRG